MKQLSKLLSAVSVICLSSLCCLAQSTRIRGRVTESDTGDAIPFAGVYFKGTTIGIAADMDGYFMLETRDTSASVLVCQLLGYDTQEFPVHVGGFNEINFALNLTDNQLDRVIVKADNKKIRRLLERIDSRRTFNNPEGERQYQCDVYSKIELDLTNAREKLADLKALKAFDFVFDYMDTSVVSGVPYLPVMISESVARRRHSSNPEVNNETIVANQISGINPDFNLLSQFTGSLHLRVNFYKSFINAFDVEFPSPIQRGGLLFYDYFIVDSLAVDGRNTYVVHYRPKAGISSPAFEGEMRIAAEDYALKSIHAKMKRGGNVNWLRDIVIDSDYKRLPDSTWFWDRDQLYADFSVALSDSSKMLSLIGTRQMVYGDPDFTPFNANSGGVDKVKVDEASTHKDDTFWENARPFELTQKEKDIYKMVEEIKDVPLYKTAYDVIYSLVNGYYDIGKIGFGPYGKIVSFNNLEGFRMRMGVRTSRNFSKKDRWTVFAAYGTKDKEWKYGLKYEHMFRMAPTRKLTVDLQKDVFQLGRGTSVFTDANLLASLLGKSDSQRLCPLHSYSIMYEHEFNVNFNAQADISLKRYDSNYFVPMNDLNGNPIPSVASNEIHLMARLSREETTNRGLFTKKYIHTNYPVFFFELTGSVPGIRKNDYGFLRPEFSMTWKFRVPPAGMSKIRFNAGTIIGQVPYPLLHIHEGNGTYVMDKTAFSCMDYFEFVSDTWVSLFWNHSFNGFFLGKIPLLRKLNLREELTVRATYGSLRDQNNPLKNKEVPMSFPEMMTTLGKVPYVEVGAGISNILNVIRVDCIWRLTHRQRIVAGKMEPVPHLFSINIGAEFRF